MKKLFVFLAISSISLVAGFFYLRQHYTLKELQGQVTGYVREAKEQTVEFLTLISAVIQDLVESEAPERNTDSSW